MLTLMLMLLMHFTPWMRFRYQMSIEYETAYRGRKRKSWGATISDVSIYKKKRILMLFWYGEMKRQNS